LYCRKKKQKKNGEPAVVKPVDKRALNFYRLGRLAKFLADSITGPVVLSLVPFLTFSNSSYRYQNTVIKNDDQQ